MSDFGSGTKKWTRGIVARLSALVVLCIWIIAALIIALVANVRANHAVHCVNDTLGTRNAPSAHDATAHIDFAVELQKVLTAPKATQPAEYRHFLDVLHDYVHTLETDQHLRAKHPLGRC